MNAGMQNTLKWKVLVSGIAVGVGILHFITGEHYRGPIPAFVNGYLIDILLPFAMFLILGVTNYSLLQSRMVRCLLVFGIGAGTETLQYFGVPLFGRTFDPLDYLMFGIGTAGAVFFERSIPARV